MPATLEFAPRLMPAPQAAHYLGVSESTLRNLGIPRKQMGGKKLYDRIDLDHVADNLPNDGNVGELECDIAFGTP